METLNSPFLLKPVGKDYLWGGTRLKDDFGKTFDMDPLAETWECSTHPAGQSVVSGGPYDGRLLTDVLKEHPEYLGEHPNVKSGDIPVLIKFIDAKKDLSVQVHPTDEYAKEHENGASGKTEMWYVIDAEPGACLVCGFKHKVTKEAVKKAIARGTLEGMMNHYPVEKGDFFFIPPGTVHAIGHGCLVVEVQESSDITYRLYDYNRLDKSGQKRELHIEKALEVANLDVAGDPRKPMGVYRFKPGRSTTLLARCQYFQVERMLINTERVSDAACYRTGTSSFQVLLCYDGCGTLSRDDNSRSLRFFKGDCIFVPANSPAMRMHGKASLLRIRC